MSLKTGATTKGYFKVKETGEIRKFQFNPEAFSDSQNFNYSVISSPCSSYPKFQYVGTGERTISLNLFLYGKKGEVNSYLSFLDSLKPKNRFDPPKIIIFAFGGDVKTCVITGISRTFNEFGKDLSITQADVTLNLTEVK